MRPALRAIAFNGAKAAAEFERRARRDPALAAAATARGETVAVYKPTQAGTDDGRGDVAQRQPAG